MRYVQSGTIVGFIGRMGSGKTYNMTRIAHQAAATLALPVYANYSTTFAHKVTSEVEVFGHVDAAGDGGVEYGVMCLDELGFILNSRSFAENASISTDLMLFRKRDIAMFYTVQSFNMVDLRVREQTAFLLYHVAHPLGAVVQVCEQTLSGSFVPVKKYGLRFVPRVFGLYDTKDRKIILESRKKKRSSSAPAAGSLPSAKTLFGGAP